METLDIAKEIAVEEYINLVDPIFIGQSRLDDEGYYWMVFKSNDVLYKIHNSL